MLPFESHSAFLWLTLVLAKSFVDLEVSASECYDNGGKNVTEENDTVRSNVVEDIYIRHYYGPTMCDYNEDMLSNWSLLLTAPQFKPEGISTLYIHGFTETPLSNSVITVTRAYLARRDENNFFFLDWSNMDHEPYFFNALPNCPKVANETARVLSKLFGKGLELSRFHLVGHSLGGQISGMIGKAIADYGITLIRISGLDPAGPGFNTEVYSTTHLEATDAEFVDVVHTDATKFGTRRHSGHADFWPNGGVMQPGCPEDSVRDHGNVFCSHQRSWIYWAESVMNPRAFEARRIPSISDVQFLRRDADHNETVNIAYMGIATDSSARGDYFLLTNSNSPYGRGKEGL